MTTTPPDTSQPQEPAPDSGPRVGWDDIRDLARIRRSRANRRVAGVAGGLGRHLDIDPVILRVAFVVLTFFGGVGVLLYGALWLLLPQDGSDWAKIKLDRRSRTVALVLVGALALLLLFSHGWWGDGGPFFLLAIVVGVVALVIQVVRRARPGPAEPPAYPTYDAPAAAGSTEVPSSVPTSAPSSETGQDAAVPSANRGTFPYTPPSSYAVPEQPRPVNPRKKGPILFWFALAVMAVALGTLGIADLAGAEVAPSAYPATVLGLSAAFLLIGSFFGRAGGIILVGLIAGAITVGSTVADRWEPHSTTVIPATASAVLPEYTMDVGEIRLDLTVVREPQALDGRTIHVTGNVGHIEVRVPAGVTVESNSDVTGVGGIDAFGRESGGIDASMTAVHDAGVGAPHLTIDTDLHVGGIDVHVGRDY
jgi:phage shock protein PspC (stress-responsive transcriptional regulator)